MSFAYEAAYLRRHFLLMSLEIFSYVCRRDIPISSIQWERMYMGGKLPVFRLIQQRGQFCRSCCPARGTDRARESDYFVKARLPALVMLSIRILFVFSEAYQKT